MLGLLQRAEAAYRLPQGGYEWAATVTGEAAVTAPSTTELLSCQVLLNTVIPYVTAGGVQESGGECFQWIKSGPVEHTHIHTQARARAYIQELPSAHLQGVLVWGLWRVERCNLSCSSSPSTVYEAGKAAKAGYPPSVSGVPGPYSIPSVPLGGAPSSGMLMDKPHPPPLAPSDSTGGSHSGKWSSRLSCPTLLLGFHSDSLLIKTISPMMLLWTMIISILQMGSWQLYQISPEMHVKLAKGCRTQLPLTFFLAPTITKIIRKRSKVPPECWSFS